MTDIPSTPLREALQTGLQDSMVLTHDSSAPRGTLANPIGYRAGRPNFLLQYDISEGFGRTMLDNDFNPLSPLHLIIAVPTKEAWNALVKRRPTWSTP